MTTLAEAFAEGVRWRERQNNNGIVRDEYIEAYNPYIDDEPPRIEDLAPGTTFAGWTFANAGPFALRWTGSDVQMESVASDRWMELPNWQDYLDPSTIRDVTLPA